MEFTPVLASCGWDCPEAADGRSGKVRDMQIAAQKCQFRVRLNGAKFGGSTINARRTAGITTIILSRMVRIDEETAQVLPTILDGSALHLVEIGYGTTRTGEAIKGVWRFNDARLVEIVAFDGDANSDDSMMETLMFHSKKSAGEVFDPNGVIEPGSTHVSIPSRPPPVALVDLTPAADGPQTHRH